MRADVSFIGILEREDRDKRVQETIKNKSKTKISQSWGESIFKYKGLT